MQTVHHKPQYTGTFYGVELEIEAEGLYEREDIFDEEGDLIDHNDPDIPEGWLRESEESIKGVELISRRPFDFDTSVANIRTLFKDIDRQGYMPVRTCRGSTHVHVNAGDLSWDQLRSFVMACAWAEPFLIEHAGTGRKGNLFAQSYEHTPLGWRPVINWCRTRQINNNVDTHYMATSFQPLGYLGSVEFRMGPSSRNAQEAIDWLTKISYVAEWGRNQTVDDTESSAFPMLFQLSDGLSDYTFQRLRHKARRFAAEIWQDMQEPYVKPKPRRRGKATPMINQIAFYNEYGAGIDPGPVMTYDIEADAPVPSSLSPEEAAWLQQQYDAILSVPVSVNSLWHPVDIEVLPN